MIFRHLITFTLLCSALPLGRAAEYCLLSGQVHDPQKGAVPDVRVQLLEPDGQQLLTITDAEGHFKFQLSSAGTYTLRVSAPAFAEVSKTVEVAPGINQLQSDIALGALSAHQESITVTADTREGTILFPDPSQQVFVRQELLDANPGRPGNPISIPGVPIETASGGIKAPQYFSPGVPEITVSLSHSTFRSALTCFLITSPLTRTATGTLTPTS